MQLNMRTKRTAALCLAACVSACLFGMVAARPAFADSPSLVGSWVAQVTPNGPPPFTNLATMTRGGGVINWDPDVGAGHGAWAKEGGNTFDLKFVNLIPASNPSFPPGTTATVTATLTVAPGGDEATGPFLTVVKDADGNELLSFEGTVALTRIEVEE